MSARVLVTGAGGFVGGHLCPALAARGFHVHGLLRPGAAAPPADAVEWIPCDLTDADLEPRLPPQVDHIIHLAQSQQYRSLPAGARDLFQVNIQATFNLLEYARKAGAQRFIFASTGGVHGAAHKPCRETDPLPEGLPLYPASKRIGEHLVAAYRDHFTTFSLRLFFVYGPGQPKDRFIPGLIRRVREGAPITLAGEVGLTVNPLHVTDAAALFERSLTVESEAGVWSAAGPQTLTLRAMGTLIGQRLGREARFEIQPIQGPSPHMSADIDRLRAAWGFSPKIDFATGLSSVIA